jgi:hypothetical protein
LAFVLALTLVGCGDSDRDSGSGWQAVYDTVGDTVVVRTVSGSVWGDTAELLADLRIGQFDGPDEYMFGKIRSLAVGPDGTIYVYDVHAEELRMYSATGDFVKKIGRMGGGPGEYREPDAGLAVLPDGRLLLRDPRNTRINVYSRDGEYIEAWRIRGFWSGRPMWADTIGNVYTGVLLDPAASLPDWRLGVVRYSASGIPGDTIPMPQWDYERPKMYAGSGRNTSDWSVPFTPDAASTFSPLGYTLGGVPTRYAFDLFIAPNHVLRLSRDNWKPAPVAPGERAEQEAMVTSILRRTEPGWRWNGPPIPDTKPSYKDFFADSQGRIWVQLHAEAYELPEDEAVPPPDAPWIDDVTQRWLEPVVYDVFEPDGRYLGMVRAPNGFLPKPPPVARGDTVWAVVLGEMDVPSIVRFRIVRGANGST